MKTPFEQDIASLRLLCMRLDNATIKLQDECRLFLATNHETLFDHHQQIRYLIHTMRTELSLMDAPAKNAAYTNQN